MLKACSYCGKIHPKGYQCPLKPKRNYNRDRRKKAPSEADRYRHTARWISLSKIIKERDGCMCQACIHGLGSPLTPFEGGQLEVHHIDSLEEHFEKRDDEENLITLCKRHHSEAEAGAINTGQLKRIAGENSKKAQMDY